MHDVRDNTPDLELLFVFELDGLKFWIRWQQPDLATLLFQRLDGELSIHSINNDAAMTGCNRTINYEDESPRVWWRLQHLREWSHEEETESIYTGRS